MKDKIAEIVYREIESNLRDKDFILLAIDGRCGSGKTTLAGRLQEICRGKALSCEIVHMDHFYPRLEQRTAERLNEAGGNLDRERFLDEVMKPLKRREAFSYRPYDPRVHQMAEAIHIGLSEVIIIEGSYSCHPALYDNYDLRIFLTVDEPERLRRIRERNGEEGLLQFQEKWIPMEESSFSAYRIEERCELHFKTG